MSSIDTATKNVVFMSVDIADSTRFKELYGVDDDPRWLEAFKAFFKELPLILMGQIAIAIAEADDLPNVSVWKAIGDELVFRAEPRNGGGGTAGGGGLLSYRREV